MANTKTAALALMLAPFLALAGAPLLAQTTEAPAEAPVEAPARSPR